MVTERLLTPACLCDNHAGQPEGGLIEHGLLCVCVCVCVCQDGVQWQPDISYSNNCTNAPSVRRCSNYVLFSLNTSSLMRQSFRANECLKQIERRLCCDLRKFFARSLSHFPRNAVTWTDAHRLTSARRSESAAESPNRAHSLATVVA